MAQFFNDSTQTSSSNVADFMSTPGAWRKMNRSYEGRRQPKPQPNKAETLDTAVDGRLTAFDSVTFRDAKENVYMPETNVFGEILEQAITDADYQANKANFVAPNTTTAGASLGETYLENNRYPNNLYREPVPLPKKKSFAPQYATPPAAAPAWSRLGLVRN